jgi:hypothetical protein
VFTLFISGQLNQQFTLNTKGQLHLSFLLAADSLAAGHPAKSQTLRNTHILRRKRSLEEVEMGELQMLKLAFLRLET